MKSKMESKTKIISLKSCPFCGGKAKFEKVVHPWGECDDGITACWVRCIGCGASTEMKLSLKQAAAAWNQRQNENMC